MAVIDYLSGSLSWMGHSIILSILCLQFIYFQGFGIQVVQLDLSHGNTFPNIISRPIPLSDLGCGR